MAIKSHGAAASLELAHRGVYGAKFDETYCDPIGPCAFIRDDGVHVRGMDEQMIDEAIEQYADAAESLKLCGYDTAMIHGAHGWLPAQFFSPIYNHRSDRWGGSFENRARFAVELCKRVRKRVGNDFVIEYRISGDEMMKGGVGIDETIELIKMLESDIDLIHVSAGIHEERDTLMYMFSQSGFTKHGCNVHLAEAVKKSGVKIPVITVGGISTPELAEQILEDGKADIISLGRTLIADPDFPNKARKGKAARYGLVCAAATACTSRCERSVWCAVNPQAGQDFRWRFTKALGLQKMLLSSAAAPAV